MKSAKDNPLIQLKTLGQSIWLDYIRRDLITNGELRRMIEDDGLSGMTSNPSIFEKAILETHDYDAEVRSLTHEGMVAQEIYEAITQNDVEKAADEFRSTYERTDGRDGYVSLEVNPHLAHDTEGTIEEARRLWDALDRPNVLIKVPATIEGVPAIAQLIGEGINVNITLIFGLPRYRAVAEAYINGIEGRLAKGWAVGRVASVASFFLSRIDTMVDPLLEKIIARGGKRGELARPLLGQAAVANAKVAYQIFKEMFESGRFRKHAENGARQQRVLWASTGTKNPKYSDVKYIEEIIGPDTVNTLPVETLNAYRDHGSPKPSLELGVDRAREVLDQLLVLGISIDEVTQQLEDEGVEKFCKPFDKLMETLAEKTTRQVASVQ